MPETLDENEFLQELAGAVQRVVDSPHPKKIVVAGPGAGKTSLFKKLLSKSNKENAAASHLVVTFINGLADELKRDLSEFADVYTFHAYCKQLLHKNPELRDGLTENFVVYPKLANLIKSDWALFYKDVAVPLFVGMMRQAIDNEATRFFIDRSNYYDAVSFDDMVFRVFEGLNTAPQKASSHDLILVDEYQDFNVLEVSLLEILGRKSPIVVAGDDDQVLYGALRGSNWNLIRTLYSSPQFEHFELPFCLRCPEVIVNAFDDIIKKAISLGHLSGRIVKSYRYFPPYKHEDSSAHPRIEEITTSIQRAGKGNYFGRVISHIIRSIPKKYIQDSWEGHYPTVLIIGNKQYLSQISAHLKEQGFILDERKGGGEEDKITRAEGLAILKEDNDSKLGWRIVLELDKPSFFKKDPLTFLQGQLHRIVPSEYREMVLREALEYTEPSPPAETPEPKAGQPTIKLTSFQGAKGLSAQYVFVVGLHDKDLPRNSERITDIEICELLVALTRTRKQCYLLRTNNFAGQPKSPSVFLRWIDRSRKESIFVNADYLSKRNM